MKYHKYTEILENANIYRYVERDMNVDRLKDILNKRIQEKFTNFTIMFCWKVNITEYSFTKVKEEVPDSGSNQKSLHSIIKRVFNYIGIDNFEEFTLIFVSDIKKSTYRTFLSEVVTINIVGYQIVYYISNEILSLVSEYHLAWVSNRNI